jgi:hypothetical protein
MSGLPLCYYSWQILKVASLLTCKFYGISPIFLVERKTLKLIKAKPFEFDAKLK